MIHEDPPWTLAAIHAGDGLVRLLLGNWSLREPPRREKRPEADFAGVVVNTVREKNVEVLREERIRGASGHLHRASIFVPKGEIIMEPVGAEGNWNQVASVYTKFGDLANANGYRLLSVVDDRERIPNEEISRMLVQVSGVVQWSKKDEWIGELIPTK
ncbi:MAG: hypothetical protein MSC30_18420 [Gaiellaceae bacterium MAG52_C11]|nr:hypothetical protein [Candidatus Gaiellasilicea maunaloa]